MKARAVVPPALRPAVGTVLLRLFHWRMKRRRGGPLQMTIDELRTMRELRDWRAGVKR